MSVCASCRWDNDADTGPCAGCGRELSGQEPPPERQAQESAEPVSEATEPVGEPTESVGEPGAGIVRAPSRTVSIDPLHRSAPRVVEPQRGGPRAVQRGQPAPIATARGPAGDRTPPPIRSIPVVVSDSDGRPTVRGQRADADRSGTAVRSDPGVDLLRTGGTLCRTCGAAVPIGRQFCRCGAQLSAGGVEKAEASGGPDVAGMSRSAFRRAQRRANGGRRPRYDAPLSVRTWLFRLLLVLLVLGAVGSQVPPWGDDVRDWIETRVEQVAPW